jgi:hypothetical protein
MKNNLHITKLRLPVYGGSVWIIICPSIAKALDWAEDQMSHPIIAPEDKSKSLGYCYSLYEEGRRRYLLFLKPNAKPGTIAHECNHLVNMMFSWHGIKLSTSNDEAECYYLDFMVDRTHSAINTYKKKYPKKNKIITPKLGLNQNQV